MDKNHPTFIVAIENKLTNLLKEIKASETILEIDYKSNSSSCFGILYGL